MSAPGLSLTLRITLVTVAVIAVFFLITATLLERAFRENAEDAVMTRLEAQLLLLMGVVEVSGPHEVRLPELLPEARLSLPAGGLYARILDRDGETLWRSPSALGVALGDWRERQMFQHEMTVRWELPEQSFPLTFQVLEDREAYIAQIDRYRRTLWGALALLTALLMAAQALALGLWGLRPLRRVRADLEALRLGENRRLEGRYPREIGMLTDSINALLEFERERLQRQGNALADLAHSLKTPLSALRLAVDRGVGERSDMRLQIERMQEMIEHELNQAQRLGPSPFQAPLVLAPVIERTCAALQRVADHHGVVLETVLQPECTLRIDTGALFELLGNVLDNALRHARSRVRVTLGCGAKNLVLCVDDDGPGIPEAEREQVLQRGTRRDTRVGGQGLGLHIVLTLVRDHGGELSIEHAPELGGARIRMMFPGD
ncbi:Sensor protein PhoQ [Thioalkalivibrio nitratireducens DSM 14787]|uniref:histidine kinase n=1 Tax=Thioalkalivibrio nitratireducens (strain DSM 14787 / UNIQEM 213 / ALEN2) TaxID=1255043 RepID=L0DRP3_THIND|nr:ATP-binding protein [Thioalkalivibrio nitratireducens]AGA32259.1 Sensor protein PhoQ [Thioalkalivibrio nitratireducens DSM 14787]